MTGVDASSLLEKIADAHWSFVIHDSFWHVEHAQAAPCDDGLQGEFVYSRMGGNSMHNIAKCHHLSQFWSAARHGIVQTPQQVRGMTGKRILVVDRHRTPANHADCSVGEAGAKSFERVLFGDDISADKRQ